MVGKISYYRPVEGSDSKVRPRLLKMLTAYDELKTIEVSLDDLHLASTYVTNIEYKSWIRRFNETVCKLNVTEFRLHVITKVKRNADHDSLSGIVMHAGPLLKGVKPNPFLHIEGYKITG